MLEKEALAVRKVKLENHNEINFLIVLKYILSNNGRGRVF